MEECKNDEYNLGDLVYFVVLAGNQKPYLVKYQVNEKHLTHMSIGYKCGAIQEQDDPEILQLIEQQMIGRDIQTCGESIFRARKDAINKTLTYFEGMINRLKEME